MPSAIVKMLVIENAGDFASDRKALRKQEDARPTSSCRPADFWNRIAVPGKPVSAVLPHVAHHGGAEASHACATRVANAGVHDPDRPGLKKLLREGLRFDVAVGVQRRVPVFSVSKVVKLSAKIRQVIVVSDAVVKPAYFGIFGGFAKRDFFLRGFKRERSIPGAGARGR